MTTAPIESLTERPTNRAAPVYVASPLTASTARALSTDNAGAPVAVRELLQCLLLSTSAVRIHEVRITKARSKVVW
jgi:hypothetical protein